VEGWRTVNRCSGKRIEKLKKEGVYICGGVYRYRYSGATMVICILRFLFGACGLDDLLLLFWCLHCGLYNPQCIYNFFLSTI